MPAETGRASLKGKGGRKTNISGNRDSVESFVVVFLFFLLLGLEAEAFVIPTGSMAPTLMGRHKEVVCPECGSDFAVNADAEVEIPGTQIVAGTCVNCRYRMPIGEEPNFQGDRIYVMKTPITLPFLPELGRIDLNRWDVTVFKLPEKPEVRYIKRMVGMPGEVVRILRGDIWTRPLNDKNAPFKRAIRPLKHQDAMQILVYDDTHRAKSLANDLAWTRWSVPEGWQPGDVGIYHTKPSIDWKELRYRHLVPDLVQWAAIGENQPLPHAPRSTLITDFYSYNTELTADALELAKDSHKAWSQTNWVGDLTLEFDLDVTTKAGEVRIDLVKAGVTNRCVIDLDDETVTLWRGDERIAGPLPAGDLSKGRRAISFANVDDRLTLKIDGRLPCGEGVSYVPGEAICPTAEDLQPVGVATRGAEVSVGGLVIKRDIYYTRTPSQADLSHFDDKVHPYAFDPVATFDWLADPSRFSEFADIAPKDFEIRPGHYMMLGDNSPWSRDGRDWNRDDQKVPGSPSKGWDDSGRETWEVPEMLLIGKAFCVYWPHLTPFGPKIKVGSHPRLRDVRIPARPSLERMRWIR